MVKKLRIAHVTATFPPYQGGTGNVCYYNARELVRLGHDLHVFTASYRDAPLLEKVEGITIHRLKPVVRVGNAPLLLQLYRRLRDFDLIHLHYPFISGDGLTSLSARHIRTPLFVTYHSDLVRAGNWRDIIFAAASSIGRTVIHQAAVVLFVSEGHAKNCDQSSYYYKYPERCQVLPNGIDTELFSPTRERSSLRRNLGLDQNHKIIGFVGALDRAHHYKGLDVLLNALTLDDLSDLTLLVAGEGELRRQYEQEASNLGISHTIQFLGGLEQEQLPSFYNACDVIAMPSSKAESFGLVAAEALACGIPVVASDWPGLTSLIKNGENGLLVQPNNSGDLSKALCSILSLSGEKWQKIGAAGRNHIKANFDCQQIGLQLESIYFDALSENRQLNRSKDKVTVAT